MKSRTLLTGMGILLGAPLFGVDTDTVVSELTSPDYDLRNETRLNLKKEFAEAAAVLMNNEAAVIEALNTELPLTERLYLIRILEWFGSSNSVDTLCLLLDDADEEVRDSARRALVAIPDAGAGACLVNALNVASDAQKGPFIDALVYRNEAGAEEIFTGLLDSENEDLVAKAAQALGKLGSESSLVELKTVRKSSSGSQRELIELAMLDIGPSTSDVNTLARKGSTGAVRSGAFVQLVEADVKKARGVLKSALSGKPFPGHSRIIHHAMTNGPELLQSEVMRKLAGMTSDDQQVVISAIQQAGLSQFEADLLELLPKADDDVQASIIATLGDIGGDESFDTLYAAFAASPRDRNISQAVSRLKSDKANTFALNEAMNGSTEDSRITAIKVLELRNAEGAVDVLNTIVAGNDDADIRVAAAKSLEVIGDVESVRILLSLIIDDVEPLKATQLSLKRLSLRFNDGDYLWEHAYQGALESAPSDEARERVLLILDGNPGEQPLAYVAAIVFDPEAGMRPLALRTLQRWPYYTAGKVWLELAAEEGATEEDIAEYQDAFTKVLTASWVGGPEKEKLEMAVQAIQGSTSEAFKGSILECYEGERLHYRYRIEVEEVLGPLLEDPEIADRVQAIIDVNS